MSICARCNKIKNGKGFWQKAGTNSKKNCGRSLTHCICNACAQKEYPELYLDMNTFK